ncbi:hypothetical protein BsWGS_03978 [Bradybaena similaris]
MSDSQTDLTPASRRKNRGCYLSFPLAFLLVFLAALVAVGVGIIVHFAGGSRQVVCNCQSSVAEKPSAEQIKQECVTQAGKGDPEICKACAMSSTTLPSTPDSGYTTMTSVAPGSAATTTVTPPKVTDVRLPTSVYPLHYDVELQTYMNDPNPDNFTFKGSVRIVVRCDEATDNITLHVNVITVDPSSIRFDPETPSGTQDPKYVSFEKDKARQFFILRLDKDMEVGRSYIVQMSFTSPLKNDLHGLYYSAYKRDNQTIYLASTQFQPTDARKAFPCFDEPAIKATFKVTLVRPSDRVSISNMPNINSNSTFQENGITYVKDVYQTTPKMSTYLLAFIVCDFNYSQSLTKYNVTYRAWATPQSVDQTEFALDAGVKIIEYFEDYFNVTYPLPKQDMIAIPDFAAGAMENWGLITYRETAMLYKEGVSNEANKERVAIVVSHELAHQWFGNLVTPSWWDDLWLNEGFASFVEFLGVDKIHPEWRMFEKFVISDVQNAFDFDGLASSHPVYVPVGHPDEINEIFDTISYAKGASIIRMMRFFLGEDTFRKGITNYLRKLSYGAAFHNDLWNALTEQAQSDSKDLNVTDIMATWALQMNFPVVTVTRDNSDSLVIRATQQRYLSDPAAKGSGKYVSPFNYMWSIPLTFTSSSSPDFNQSSDDVHWMNRTERTKTFRPIHPLPSLTDHTGWVLANVQQYGYYRVNYEVSNWRALGQQLETNHLVIATINRAQIINDAWNLAKAGHIGLDTALATIEYLHKERDYIPWYAARTELNYVESMLALTPLYGAFQKFMRSTLNDTFNHFGLANISQDHVDVSTQSLVAAQSCYYGIQSCLEEVTRQYRAWMTDPSNNPINPNIKNVVYCYAIHNGDWEEWNFALRMYNEIDVASEKASLLSAMSCSKQQWILSHYMHLILEKDSPIRKQDALSVVAVVARNNMGRSLAWDFFRGKYDVLKSQFGSSFFAWSNVISAVTQSFNTNFHLNELTTFKQSHAGNLGSGERAFDQAIEKVNSNIKWMTANIPILTQWLQDKQYLPR